MEFLFDAPALLLQAGQNSEAAEVKYIVALVAAVASIVVALISAGFSILGLMISRFNQSELQQQQANNLKELEHLKSQLTLTTQTEIERSKAQLVESGQARLEALKAELAAKSQQEIELLRGRLGEQGRERDARRDYEYSALKRLYTECEPLIFQLADLAEHAYYRIHSIARTARLGKLEYWMGGNGYYKISTMYKLMIPLVVFRLIQQRLTFVDLTLDSHLANQYRLLKTIYLTFTDPFDFANLEPKIDYDPDVDDWASKRQDNPQKHWRQGLYLGVLDNSIDALLVPNEKMRWKTYGEFESDFRDRKSETHVRFLSFADILHEFHPKTRPVFWRILWTQSLIYKQIIDHAGTSRVGLAAV